MEDGPGWSSGEDLSLNRYGGLMFRARYQEIHRFLRNEAFVAKGLARLDQMTRGMGRARFRDFLALQERRFGFAPTLGVIPANATIVDSSRFWGYLMRGEPLVDLGARDDSGHGVLTHRVQWVLVGQWNDRMGGIVGPASTIGALYRNLATGNARVLSGLGETILNDPDVEPDKRKVTGNLFDAVWNDVFDAGRTVRNATRPEHLFSYTSAAHPGLFHRMLWPQ